MPSKPGKNLAISRSRRPFFAKISLPRRMQKLGSAVKAHRNRNTRFPRRRPASNQTRSANRHPSTATIRTNKIQLAGARQRSAGEQKKKGGNRKTELTREYSNKQDGIGDVGQIVAHARPSLYRFRSYSSARFAILREKKAREPFPYYWAKMFPTAAGSGKFLGASVFGFLGVIVREKRRFR
jgi:hypothetical protein